MYIKNDRLASLLNEPFTVASKGKNNMGADTSARHCIHKFTQQIS